MSRINYPTTAAGYKKLNEAIILQNTAQPTILLAFLAQHEIDLAANESNLEAAVDFENIQITKSAQSENATQLRDITFDPIFTKLIAMIQFIKKFYTPNFKELAEWGVPITTTGKIDYPSDIVDRMEIFNNFKARHDSFAPGTSPLVPYLTKHSISLPEMATKVGTTRTKNNESKALANQSEAATEERDNLLNPAAANIHLIGDFLKSLYEDNSKGLGEWGFEVDDSPAKVKDRNSTLKLGQKRTYNSILIGSVLTNTGTAAFAVHKGKTVTDNPTILQPKGTLGITKGFSMLTIVNTSELLSAKIKIVAPE